MERLCIYVIYDRKKIVDLYIREILIELKKYVSRLIVVCNFDAAISGMENIVADEILYRENVGYDAGAYKDVLSDLGDKINCYDEIILTNDTYYAPIFPFEEMFSRMDKTDCDFWGMTRYPGGIEYEVWRVPPHIQSYFLCLRKKIIQSRSFKLFWEQMPYCDELKDAIRYFEVSINEKLQEQGFKGMAYMDFNEDVSLSFNENPYLCYPDRLIKEYHIPLIKRRALEFDNGGFPQALEALNYIKKYTNYDIDILEKHLYRVTSYSSSVPSFDLGSMDRFVNKYARIYIYGNGKWGKNLAAYFKYKGWNYNGHLVTDPEKENEKKVDEILIDSDLGIIIAISRQEIVNEIYSILRNYISEEQIFMPINLW